MPSFHEEFGLSLSTLSKLAGEIGTDWMVIGGIAVASWGEPRNTKDLDFSISASIDRASDVQRILNGAGWDLIEGPGQIKDTKIWLSMFEKSGAKRDRWRLTIDVFFTMSDWQRHAMERRRYIQFMGLDYWTASPEDLIIFKLIADRGKDQGDIDGILDRSIQKIDRVYIERWTSDLGVRDRWMEALTRHQDRLDSGI
jgi:hypothetical protein